MRVLFIYSYEYSLWTPVAYGDASYVDKELETFNKMFTSLRYKVIDFDDSYTIYDILHMHGADLDTKGVVVSKSEHLKLDKEPMEIKVIEDTMEEDTKEEENSNQEAIPSIVEEDDIELDFEDEDEEESKEGN